MNDVSSPRRLQLAAVPGDGIGPEVTTWARAVLEAAVAPEGVQVGWTEYDLGAERYLATGELLPDSVLAELAAQDAILLGAVGDPRVPPGVIERGLLLRIRFELDHHVNLRPARTYAGVASPVVGVGPGDVDLVVLREGTEGLYAGAGGALRRGTPHEVATEESLNTAYGVERVVRHAFVLAASRRKHVTLVHKTNVLVHAGALWQRVFASVAAEHPEITTGYLHVDAAMIFLVTDPGRFDVVVTDNLFGDVVTDLVAAVTGGIGLAASGNVDTTRAHASMFEPVHGSAPDIAGTGRADPTAAILSAALLLDHVGLAAAADRVRTAITTDLASRLGRGHRSTADVGRAVVALVEGV